ncbi:MAG: class SAM-dependent methyltransferase [Segetibacter sp.]|nr:class SAM-dependent methyltransferase [Segetibacter sp.]
MKDRFSAVAAEYASYRPTYPKALIEFLAESVEQKETVWDVGTGNGQLAVELAKHFKSVLATDLSSKQIEYAEKRKNIFYSVEAAEETTFDAEQLIL